MIYFSTNTKMSLMRTPDKEAPPSISGYDSDISPIKTSRYKKRLYFEFNFTT